jgi:predicted glutamine amidotransferase
MCGIVGRAGALGAPDERIFKVMLLLDYFRGQDSTGVASITKKGYSSVLKIADDPIMLFNHKEYEEVVAGVYDSIWIGHNRAATIGVTTRQNAHPFECDHIVGVHNGTLTKDAFNTLGSWLDKSYDTDSETLYRYMAEYGVDETISRLQGAWALVWFDAKEQTLNMIRNSERPLFTAVSKRGETRFLSWASEYEMIAAAREMSGAKALESYETDDEGFAFFPLPIDTLHTWTLEQILAGDFTAKTRPLKGRPKTPVITTVGTPSNTNTYKSPAPVEKKDTYSVVNVAGDLDDEKLVLGEFTPVQWDEMTNFGCAVCGADINEHDEGLLVCVNEGVVLCPSCSETSKTTIVNSYTHQLAAAL